MKQDIYYLFENDKQIHHSYYLEKLLNFIPNENLTNATIYINDTLVWGQHPQY